MSKQQIAFDCTLYIIGIMTIIVDPDAWLKGVKKKK